MAQDARTAVMEAFACRAVARFEKFNHLGTGTYGVVHRARDKDTNEIVALKKIHLHRRGDQKEPVEFPSTSIREIKILKSMRHPNIVNLKEIAVGSKPDSIFLVFEYCEHDLARMLERINRPFTESEIKTILLQLLSAIRHLHANNVVHRDLKLSNILMNGKGEMKLADFGLARSFPHPLEEMSPNVVTLWYRPPEILLGSTKYHTAVDLWAVGCIFGELLKNEAILPGQDERQQLELIYQLLGMPNDKIWPGYSKLPQADMVVLPQCKYNNLSQVFSHLSPNGLDLLSRLLTYDPSKRISADRALSHPYFGEKPFPADPRMMPTFPSTNTAPIAAAAASSSSSLSVSLSASLAGTASSSSSSTSSVQPPPAPAPAAAAAAASLATTTRSRGASSSSSATASSSSATTTVSLPGTTAAQLAVVRKASASASGAEGRSKKRAKTSAGLV